jgi:hypothetical protein
MQKQRVFRLESIEDASITLSGHQRVRTSSALKESSEEIEQRLDKNGAAKIELWRVGLCW